MILQWLNHCPVCPAYISKMEQPQTPPAASSLFADKPNSKIRRAGVKTQARMLMVILLVLAAGVGVAIWYMTRPVESYTLEGFSLAPVTKAAWKDEVQLSGVVEVEDTRAVSTPETGLMLGLAVEEGDWVKAGQVLARIDPSDLEKSLTTANQDLETRQRNLDKVTTNYQFASQKALQTRKTLVRDISDAQKNLTLQQQLMKVGTVSPDDVTTAQVALQNTQDKLDAADLQSSQDAALYKLDLQAATADVANSNRTVSDLKTRIASATIKSPIEGKVIEIDSGAREKGRLMSQYTNLMSVADTRSPLVKAKLPDSNASLVTKNMVVALTGDVGQFQGKVERLGTLVRTDTSTLGTYVDLYVRPVVGSVELNIGASVSITLQLGSRENVLRVARGPWYSGSTQTSVYLVRGSTAVKTPVALGSVGPTAVEIKSGLQEGDKIIATSTQAFSSFNDITLKGKE